MKFSTKNEMEPIIHSSTIINDPMEEGVVDVKVAVVVTIEVKASLEVFLIKVIIIIGISALMTAAFFAIYQAIFVMKKMMILKSQFWTFEILHLRKKLLC